MVGRTARNAESEATDSSGLYPALAALASPLRLRIVAMLRDRELCVCHLTEALGLTQGTVSYHMGLLKQAGLVKDRRDFHDARWIYYRLDPTGVASVQVSLSALLDVSRADDTPADCCAQGGVCDPADARA
ncbi:MAG: metalloregulator ArsR/SmtB family transcription factor [Dehalococcoidia bacterium]|nr:metalloregulator ArsR/SmtB family transcription factor [Dehalococcoidia bacterium]